MGQFFVNLVLQKQRSAFIPQNLHLKKVLHDVCPTDKKLGIYDEIWVSYEFRKNAGHFGLWPLIGMSRSHAQSKADLATWVWHALSHLRDIPLVMVCINALIAFVSLWD